MKVGQLNKQSFVCLETEPVLISKIYVKQYEYILKEQPILKCNLKDNSGKSNFFLLKAPFNCVVTRIEANIGDNIKSKDILEVMLVENYFPLQFVKEINKKQKIDIEMPIYHDFKSISLPTSF